MPFRRIAVPRPVLALAILAVVAAAVAYLPEPHRIGHLVNRAAAPVDPPRDRVRKGGGGRYRAEKAREERQARMGRLVAGAAVAGATSPE